MYFQLPKALSLNFKTIVGLKFEVFNLKFTQKCMDLGFYQFVNRETS